MSKLLVTLDGKRYEANEVRVLYRDREIPGEDLPGDFCVTHTQEGLIMDVWSADGTEAGAYTNAGTSSETIPEIISRLCEENS